jgi:hypothetical protein
MRTDPTEAHGFKRGCTQAATGAALVSTCGFLWALVGTPLAIAKTRIS